MSQPFFDADDIGHNDSPNEHFQTVLGQRISRRSVLVLSLIHI